MPTYFARKAGNINATDVWATTPGGTAGAVTFVAGDVLMANSFAITVNVDTNLGATGEVRNDTANGATNGGSFTLSNGVTLTANCISSSTNLVSFAGTSGNFANIVGNCTGVNARAASNTSTGTLNITGTCTGGTAAGGLSGAVGASNTSTGTLNITGTCTGGTGAVGAINISTGTLNITGTCTGGTGAVGAYNSSTGTMFINGVIQASEFNAGVGGPSAQQVTLLTGPFLISPTFGVNPIANVSWRWASALNNQTYIEVSTQTLLQKRNLVTPDNATNFPAASNVRSGISYGIGGVVTGTCAVPSPAAVAMGTPVDNTVGTLTISVPTASEIATAVWGASTKTITGGVVDTLTNAPTVPTPSQIASQVRTELSTELGRLDVATSTRSTLTTGDLPSVPSAASVASAVRTELTELSNLDASVSSRLAGSAYTAPSTPPTVSAIASAVWAAADKTGYSLTSAERTAIATAVEGSILNEADGQAVLNAIVGAIGNTNLSEVSLVAAVRADLERSGGKLDSIPTTAAPTAAQNATAVWGAATKEITGGTVTTLTNAPTVPSAAAIATQVRTELATELARVDAAISTRLAGSAYTAPSTAPTAAANASAVRTELAVELARVDQAISTRLAGSAYTAPSNSDIAAIKAKTDNLPASPAATGDIPSANISAIKAKTDLLNTDRLAQVSTVSTTGAQLAAALS